MRTSKRAFVLMLLLVTGILLLAAPTARADQAVTFSDNQPLVIDLTDLVAQSNTTKCPCRVKVGVVNSSASGKPVNVWLYFAGQAANYLSPPAASPTAVGPGFTQMTLMVKPDATASTGTLVLRGDDGSLDREPFQLVGSLAPASGVLVPGTFDTLTVHATSFAPSFFRPPPQMWPWAGAGAGTLAACVILYILYRNWRDNKSPFVVGTVTVFAVGAGLATLVLVSGAVSSLIHDKQPNPVGVPSWTISPPAPGTVDASLAGDNGQAGLLTANGKKLSVANISYAGTYSGTIDTQPAGENGDIKATVIVRDWWLYAFAAVFIGVAIGAGISRFYQTRPSRQTQADAAAAAAAIARHESDWCERSVGQAWGEPYKLAGFAQNVIGMITSKADADPTAAAADLASLRDLDAVLEDLRSMVAALGAQRAAMCTRYAPVIGNGAVLAGPGWLAPLEDPLGLTGRGLSGAQDAVKERIGLIDGITGAANLAGQLGAQLDAIAPDIAARTGPERASLESKWVSLIEAILSAGDKAGLQPIEGQITALKQETDSGPKPPVDVTGQPFSKNIPPPSAFELHARDHSRRPGEQVAAAIPSVVLGDAADLNRDTLLTVTVQGTELAENTNVHWEFSDGSVSAVFPAPQPADGRTTELSISHSFTAGPQQASANVFNDKGQPVAVPWTMPVATFSMAQRLRAGLRADDRVVAIVAGVLAIGSGMEALYLNSPAWGSAGDYVTALLWGSVTSEGVKLIVNIVAKQWPIAS